MDSMARLNRTASRYIHREMDLKNTFTQWYPGWCTSTMHTRRRTSLALDSLVMLKLLPATRRRRFVHRDALYCVSVGKDRGGINSLTTFLRVQSLYYILSRLDLWSTTCLWLPRWPPLARHVATCSSSPRWWSVRILKVVITCVNCPSKVTIYINSKLPTFSSLLNCLMNTAQGNSAETSGGLLICLPR